MQILEGEYSFPSLQTVMVMVVCAKLVCFCVISLRERSCENLKIESRISLTTIAQKALRPQAQTLQAFEACSARMGFRGSKGLGFRV